ncbi:MAG TPA: ECF transporter S component [Candidatus Aphodoplasma excrementigallinarum]|uniref:ECF transporter S component n=1 Tax=Candidatus Aphodoplasma excrementigallinarum TaxID=2840673 RepID=A0A9D1NGD1_9FIRM|nr:ECF transporter S component [Candidatus Aphodoplasma excrementigallinarum]
MRPTQHTQTLKLCTGALLLAAGILLPQVFHMIGGQAMGGILLPMHLPVFIAGLLLGPFYGCAIGIITPLISFFVTGMPPAGKLPFMLIELLTYGLAAGLLRKRNINIYVSLILSQIAGRVANALALVFATYVLQLNVPAVITVGTAVVTGIPGLILQLVLVPAVVILIERVLHLGNKPANL